MQVISGIPPGSLLTALASSVKPNAGALEFFQALPKLPPSFPVDDEFSVAHREVPLKLDYVYQVAGRSPFVRVLTSSGHDIAWGCGTRGWALRGC